MAITLVDIADRVKRIVKWSSISGTFTELDLAFYIEDAYGVVQLDYPDLDTYTFTIGSTISGSSISPAPDIVDKVLLATRAAFEVLFSYGVEIIGDAVLLRAGSIMLDTSKAIKGQGINLDTLNKDYKRLIDNLNINGKSSSSSDIGVRIDNFITRQGDIGNKDSESLI